MLNACFPCHKIDPDLGMVEPTSLHPRPQNVFSKCIYLIRTDVTVIRTDVPEIDVILLISISVLVP